VGIRKHYKKTSEKVRLFLVIFWEIYIIKTDKINGRKNPERKTRNKSRTNP